MRLIARRVLGEQRGAAVAISMAVLTALLAITGILFASALNSNTTSKYDSDQKRAYGAAEAGAQQALYKLNKLQLLNPTTPITQLNLLCVVDLGVSPTGGECPAYPDANQAAQSLGNGTSYRYTVTPVLAGTSSCTDPFTVAGTLSALLALQLNNVLDLERCITSTGYAGDATRRVQMRVVSTLKLFGGMVADDRGDSGNDITINGGIIAGGLGTNGKIRFNGGAFTGGIEVPEALKDDPPYDNFVDNAGGLNLNLTVTYRKRPWTLASVDASASRTANNNPGGSAATNNASNFTCKQGIIIQVDCSPWPYNSTTRAFSLQSGQTANFRGSTYNFCNFNMTGGTITVGYSGNTSVFIDSPDQSGSGCASGSGGFTQSGGTTNNLSGLLDAKKLTYYVVGASGKEPTVSATGLLNITIFTASIYAPNSTIRLSGDAVTDIYKGGFSGKKIVVDGNLIGPLITNLVDLPLTLDGGLLKLYRPASLKECEPAPAVASDPESGCPPA